MGAFDKLKDVAGRARDNTIQKGKQSAKDAVKNKARNAVGLAPEAQSNTVADKAKEQASKRAMQAMKAAGKKFFTFIVSSPAGWITGLVLFILLVTYGNSAVSKIDTSKLTDNQTTADVYKGSGQGGATSGQKTVLLMDSCPPDAGGGNSGSTSGTTSSGAAADADWTTPGTTAYNNAKTVYDAFVASGFSGPAAANAVGWVNSEGSFDIVGRAEGHYSGDIKKDSIKYGAVPIPSGPGYSVGGGGIYQYTPYTDYAPLGDDKWEDAHAITEFAIKQLAAGDWNPDHDLTGKKMSFKEYAQTKSAEDVLAWNAYERGNPAYIKNERKIADAKKAIEAFGADKVEFDEAKFEAHYGASANKDKPTSSSSSSTGAHKCSRASTIAGGSPWGGKGGKTSYPGWSKWSFNQLPADLKPYALNPESLGMKYHAGQFGGEGGWHVSAYVGNQCTDLTASLMYQLWEKDGKGPVQALGDGGDVAANWAAKFGGSTKSTPEAGDVFSVRDANHDPVHGHTGVVSHVFDDGKMLVIEQNMPGVSGALNNESFSWDYRIIDKSQWENNFVFYNPSSAGYTLKKTAKTL